jgi:uncharacterized protein YndB with AHSA1/START domain
MPKVYAEAARRANSEIENVFSSVQLPEETCGWFNSHSSSTTTKIANPPRKKVKNRICFWWADGFLVRLTAGNLFQADVSCK